RRRERLAKRFRIVKNGHGGVGMVGAGTPAEGGVVEGVEGKPQANVSLGHVERRFSAEQRGAVSEYAWRLTAELFAMWSERPEDWRPIDHSCDPSAWLDGLDVVARRALAAGDAITLDYATFSGPWLKEFACSCGSRECRRVIRPADHLEPWVEQ